MKAAARKPSRQRLLCGRSIRTGIPDKCPLRSPFPGTFEWHQKAFEISYLRRDFLLFWYPTATCYAGADAADQPFDRRRDGKGACRLRCNSGLAAFDVVVQGYVVPRRGEANRLMVLEGLVKFELRNLHRVCSTWCLVWSVSEGSVRSRCQIAVCSGVK